MMARSKDKGTFASDAMIECAQECVDADWCPCKKVKYTPKEYRKMMKKFQMKESLKNVEMKVFVPEDMSNAYVRGSAECGGKQRTFFVIATFDDAGKISHVKNALPHKLTSEESEMFQKSWEAFKSGDIGSMMKMYEPDMQFHCDKKCVEAKWCSCDKETYTYDELEQWAESISKNFTQFKDVTVNGEPIMSRMDDTDAWVKKAELYFVDNTLLMPFDIAGMFNGTKIPETPMLEVFSLGNNKKIKRGALILGMAVDPLSKPK